MPPEAGVPEQLLVSESGSAERDYAEYGSVTFRLRHGFTLRTGRRIVILSHNDRWAGFLMHQSVRQEFMSVCYKVARINNASEILVLPQGTELEDVLFENVNFQEVKKRAEQLWGPPDLDLARTYNEEDIRGMGAKRVHYVLADRLCTGHWRTARNAILSVRTKKNRNLR